MRMRWLFMDFDGKPPCIFDVEHRISHSCGVHLVSQIGSFIDNSLHHSRTLCGTGSFVLQESFNRHSKAAGALVLSLANESNYQKLSGIGNGFKLQKVQSCSQTKSCNPFKFEGLHIDFGAGSSPLMLLNKMLSSTLTCLRKDVGQLSSIPLLSLAASVVPPLYKSGSTEFAGPLEISDGHINGCIDQPSALGEHQRCSDLSFPELNLPGHASEPKTGIKFPSALDSIFASEVLVGTGSRCMKILRIKSLNVYAFGLYVHPDSVCDKLGPKYASVPTSELNNRPEFIEDLLREDIDMTVRLVVNCNGLKVNTVRDVFEKSLRTRLLKMNPDTDYHCVKTFGSYFTQDIALPVGTTIHFRQTADGKLITEIGGKEIGAVHSKDLCRAFFDMYIGDVSVPASAKEEIARNVASIIKRC